MTLGHFDNAPQPCTTKHNTANRKAAFLDAMRRGMMLAEACRVTMTPDTTVGAWRKNDDTFRIELAHARAVPRELTARDRDVLRMIALGYSNPQIGHALGLSVRAAAEIVNSLMRRRGVHCRAQLAVEAVRVGAIVVEVQA